MKLNLDTGEIEEIEEASKMGLINGMTTNLSLIMKSNEEIKNEKS